MCTLVYKKPSGRYAVDCLNSLSISTCSRKKDHGRAEALLIAAWGCGWSAANLSSMSSRAKCSPGGGNASTNARSSSDSGSDSDSDSSSSSDSGGVGWSPKQGPLRDVIRMDGGMHTIVDTDAVRDAASDSDCADSSAGAWLYGAAAAEPATATRLRARPTGSTSKRRAAQRHVSKEAVTPLNHEQLE